MGGVESVAEAKGLQEQGRGLYLPLRGPPTSTLLCFPHGHT